MNEQKRKQLDIAIELHKEAIKRVAKEQASLNRLTKMISDILDEENESICRNGGMEHAS